MSEELVSEPQEVKKIIEESIKTVSLFDDNPKLSLFPNINTADNGRDITEDDFYVGVRVGTWKEEAERVQAVPKKEERTDAKKKCPYVTLSGWFPDHRNDKSCKAHSGLICIDPKNIYDVQELIAKLKRDKYVRAVFLSISATSIAIVFKIDPDKHDQAFEGLKKYLWRKYKIKIDATSDVCRARYVSYDPDIYVNKNALLFDQYSTITISKKAEKIEKKESDLNTTDDDFSDVLQQIKDQKKDITNGYDNWFHIGLAIASKYKEAGLPYFHEVSQFHPRYNIRETDEQYSYCLKWSGNGKLPITIKTFYFHARQNGISPKMNPQLEKKVVKNLAAYNQPLPSNISAEGQELYQSELNRRDEIYPYGICWQFSDTGKVSISRTGTYVVADGLGFRLLDGELVQIVGQLIHKRNQQELFNALIEYVHEDDVLQKKICDSLESFFQNSGDFTLTRLKEIPKDKILSGDRGERFKFFKNGILKINKNEIVLLDYSAIEDKLILAELIQNRDYIPYVEGQPKGNIHDFFVKAIRYDDPEIKPYADMIIGNLADEFKDETIAYITVLTEVVSDSKQGGGSGKNLFGSLFKLTTTFHSIPGSQVQLNDRFLQTWDGQRIFAINDTPKKFDFSFLKDLSSNGGVQKKLFKDLKGVPVEKMPKFIINTNHSYEVVDGGLRRRIIPLEFTDFFTKVKGGVQGYYGYHFPSGCSQTDLIGYDHIISEAIQAWIRCGRTMEPIELSDTGWLKQFDQVYGEETRIFINDTWNYWIVNDNLQKDGSYFLPDRIFQRDYDNFCNTNRIKNRKSSKVLNDALGDWCKSRGAQFIKDAKKYKAGVQIRGKWFKDAKPLEIIPSKT